MNYQLSLILGQICFVHEKGTIYKYEWEPAQWTREGQDEMLHAVCSQIG